MTSATTIAAAPMTRDAARESAIAAWLAARSAVSGTWASLPTGQRYFSAGRVGDDAALLWLATVSAGAGTGCAWWYDWHNRSELQRQDEADREAAAGLYGE